MWTVTLTSAVLNHFPLALHCKYAEQHFPGEGLPELYLDEFVEDDEYAITITPLGCKNGFVGYDVMYNQDSLVIAWDTGNQVFWYCGRFFDSIPDTGVPDFVVQDRWPLEPHSWVALAAAWLYREQHVAPVQDLLSALDRILQSQG